MGATIGKDKGSVGALEATEETSEEFGDGRKLPVGFLLLTGLVETEGL